MKEITYCPHCGARMEKYQVRITPLLTHALIKFKEAVVDNGKNKIHLLKDMKDKPYELTRHEWNNFSRQRFLGLAVKDEDSGYWLLTERGNGFLTGRTAIPESVWIFRNKIVDRSENLVYIKDVIGSTPYEETKEDIQYEPIQEGFFNE